MTEISILVVIAVLLAVYFILADRKKSRRNANTVRPHPLPEVTPVINVSGITIGPKAYRSNINNDFNATATTISVDGDQVTYIDDLTGEYKTESISDFLTKFYLSDWYTNPHRRPGSLFDEIVP